LPDRIERTFLLWIPGALMKKKKMKAPDIAAHPPISCLDLLIG